MVCRCSHYLPPTLSFDSPFLLFCVSIRQIVKQRLFNGIFVPWPQMAVSAFVGVVPVWDIPGYRESGTYPVSSYPAAYAGPRS